jgi:carbamoyl-phosphate synthase large subunit
VGARSVGVTKVDDLRALYAALEIVNDPIIQECVGTDEEEYTAGVVVFDNIARSSIVMKRDLKDGNTSRACAEPYTEINNYLENVAEKLGVYGPVNFQYRTSGNKIKIFEINARFSGTTHFRTLSNVNEVEMCTDYLLNNKEIIQPEIKPVQIVRYEDETIVPNKQKVMESLENL